MSAQYQLAQLNIAHMRAPLDSPIMAEFVAQLEEINRLADDAPGFVWRLQTAEGDATALRPYDDERIIVNMSVWDSVDALFDYVFRSRHAEVMRRRREWFDKMDRVTTVLWWIPAGHIPTVEEARDRMEHLNQHGPTPHAFTFKQRFTFNGQVVSK